MSLSIRATGRAVRAATTTVLALVLLFLLALPAPASTPGGSPPDHARNERTVTVMTRNLYLGAPLEPLFQQTDQVGLVNAATQTWATVQATDFPTRAGELAAEIADAQPHLVGLQEVSLYRSRPYGVPDAPYEVELDFLDGLMDELAALGQRYDVAVVAEGFDGSLPILTSEGLRELRLTDRDVILVRRGSGMQVSNPQTGTFDATVSAELPVEPFELTIERAWASVDVRLRGLPFRFVNTHLEAFDPGGAVRLAQAEELLAGPADTELPVVLVGDFNSGPGTTTLAYDRLTTTGGFTNADPRLRPTCCFDDLLADPDAELYSHIDLILYRGPFAVTDVRLVGTTPFQPTMPVWPSDHAGVVATLRIDR